MNYFISSRNRPLLVKSLVIVIFYVIFFMNYAVTTNYFGKKKIPIKKTGGKQVF